MVSRLPIVRHVLEKQKAASVLLNASHHVRWCTGFTGSNGLLYVSQKRAVFLTDGRYAEQVAQETKGLEIHITSGSLVDRLAELAISEPGEHMLLPADYLVLRDFQHLRDVFSGSKLESVSGLLDVQMAQKDVEELKAIQKAQSITDRVYDYLLGWLQPGMTEKRVAAEIVYQHMKMGAERMSFDPIVASGPNGALPHARPTDRVIQDNDVVILDFGCFVDGYASDMTRTVVFGDGISGIERAYNAVLQSQSAAIGNTRAEMACSTLDNIARVPLRDAELEEYFVHGLGHGVGLRIHEYPRVAKNSTQTLPESTIITIEPGVYLPGRFGVRIEDMVHVTATGCVNLTASSHELARITVA